MDNKLEIRVDKIDHEVDDIKIRLAVAESNIDKVEAEIGSIKDDTRFIRRTVTGSIVTVVIGCIIWVIKQGGI